MSSRTWETAVGERTFVWQRTNPLKDQYELSVGGRTLARLTIGGPPFVLAKLESDDLHVVFTPEWAENRRIRAGDADGQQVIATYERRWSGRTGLVQLATGGQLEWRQARWWRRRADHVVTDRWGNPLLRFRPAGGVTGYGLGTDLEPLVDAWIELVVLLALGWLLLIVAGTAVPPRLAPVSTGPPDQVRLQPRRVTGDAVGVWTGA
jgi:hypothetical protein